MRDDDWRMMSFVLPDNDPKYNDPVLGALITGGSWSVRMNFDAMSRAGAAGRAARCLPLCLQVAS